VLALWLATPGRGSAEAGDRLLELSFTPTRRAQIAIWIEDADGTFIETVALTSSVAPRGVGNRPGALQMNSGFRWPYGRREGILPIWSTSPSMRTRRSTGSRSPQSICAKGKALSILRRQLLVLGAFLEGRAHRSIAGVQVDLSFNYRWNTNAFGNQVVAQTGLRIPF
jgi:hypothetical protein